MAYTKKVSKEESDKLKEYFLKFMEQTNTAPWSSAIIRNSINSTSMNIDKKPYKGINQLICYISRLINPNWNSDCFATFNAIKAKGGMVRKGEKSIPVVYPVFLYRDENKKKITYNQYVELAKRGEKVTSTFVGYKYHYVFNLAQQEGLAYEPVGDVLPEKQVPKSVESIVKDYEGKPIIETGYNGSADGYYQPSLDRVVIPPINMFKSESEYASTLFHELMHSTEHESRLDIKNVCNMNSPTYAKNELRAEIGASQLLAMTDLPDCLEHNAAYIKHWANHVSNINNFTTVISTAFNMADKGVKWIIGEREGLKKVV